MNPIQIDYLNKLGNRNAIEDTRLSL